MLIINGVERTEGSKLVDPDIDGGTIDGAAISGTTTTTFQIDSDNTGPKLKNVTGSLQIRNEADNADAPLTASTVNALTLTEGASQFTVAGGTGTARTLTVDADASASNIHSQNTDTGTDQTSFQVGTGGPRWKNDPAGTLTARNAADDADAPIKASSLSIGDPIDTTGIEYPITEIKDDNGAVVAAITVEFDNLTAGTQNGVMKFYVMRAGTLTEVFEMDGS